MEIYVKKKNEEILTNREWWAKDKNLNHIWCHVVGANRRSFLFSLSVPTFRSMGGRAFWLMRRSFGVQWGPSGWVESVPSGDSSSPFVSSWRGWKVTPPAQSLVFNILLNILSTHHHQLITPSRTSRHFRMSPTCCLYLCNAPFHLSLTLTHWHVFYLISVSLSRCFAPSAFTCLRVVLTFPLFISSTGTTICGWPWPHCIVAQAQTHVIIIPSVEWKRIVTTTKYTSFTLGLRSCRGKRAHKSLILAQCLVGEIKQRRTASPSRDGAPDKDLSMAHFSGTEGWKEGGWYEGREKSSSNCGKGCRAGAPSLLVWQKNSCWTNSISKWNMFHHSRLPSKEFREWGRFLWKAATFRLPFQNHPHHPKKTKKHSSISLSVLQRCRQSCTGAVPCWWSSGYWSTRTWIKLCMKRDLSSGENHMIMVPQVEVECRNQCLVVPIREPGL